MTKVFRIMVDLHRRSLDGDGVVHRALRCPRGIAVAVERLLLMNAFAPVAGDSVGCQPRLMLGAPLRAGAAHVVQLGPVAVANVHDQVTHDAGEVGNGLGRLAGKAGNCGPV
ncbi:hypothetical protein EAV90_15255 [Bradyrhizobium vignae]|nr:hypothetical protein EAV90_15255 [Bradyrhizobium vignae]